MKTLVCPHCGIGLRSPDGTYLAYETDLYYTCPYCTGKWGRHAIGTRGAADAWRLHGVDMCPIEARIAARRFAIPG